MPDRTPTAAPGGAAYRGVLPCTVNLPTPSMIRGRLIADGWACHEMIAAGYHLYTIVLPDWGDAEFELILPDEDDREGWQRHVEQALRVLAGLEDRERDDAPDRPLGDIAAEIVAEAAPDPRAGAPDCARGAASGEFWSPLSDYILAKLRPDDGVLSDRDLEKIRACKSSMTGCHLALGIQLLESPEGHMGITVREDLQPSGPHERAWMEEVAVKWLRAAAPHRLAMGGDDV